MRPGLPILSNLNLFASLDADDLGALNEAADLARIGPNEVLFREGDVLDQLQILIGGLAIETRHEPGGNALTDVITPVRPLGLSAALLGSPAPTGASTVISSRLVL